jgi:hypothetical protein
MAARINRRISARRCLSIAIFIQAMSDGADQPPEQTSPAGEPSNDTGNALVVTGPFFQRTDWLSFGLTAVVVLVVYFRTLAPEVTLEYSGALSTSAKYAGVPQPPGYPVWTLYSWVFVTRVPFSNIAWRVAVGSAVAAALACGLVALMVSQAGAMLLETTPAFSSRKLAEQQMLRVVCGFVAGMVLGLSRTVWRMAVVAETWALTVLLFALMLCLLMRWTGRPERRRFLYGALFVYGLLLTGNQELFVMTPALLLVVLLSDQELGRDLSVAISLLVFADWAMSVIGDYYWLGSDMLRGAGLLVAFLLVGGAAVVAIVRTRRFGSEWRSASLCGVVFLLGLGFYLYLPFASMTNPPMNWGYARTEEGFFHLVTRGQYESYRPTSDLGRFVGQLWMLAKDTGKGFGWPYFVFAALSFGLLRRTGGCARHWLLGLAVIFMCVGPLLVGLLNPSEDRASLDLIPPFFAAMYVVLALCTGLGLMVAGCVVAKARIEPQPDAMQHF